MNKEQMDQCRKYGRHISLLCDVECSVIDADQKKIECACGGNRFCESCDYDGRDEIRTHLYGCNESYRWNGKYIYYCPIGLVFISSAVLDESGKMAGGIIAGPIVMGEMGDTLLNIKYKEAEKSAAGLPNLDTAKVNHLAEVMMAIASGITGEQQAKSASYGFEHDKILNSIYHLQEKYNSPNDKYVYPMEVEKKLQAMVYNKDKMGSQALLNELLGHIYYYSGFDIDIIKARILELVVILSRATIDAGADINEIFWFSNSYISELDSINTVEDLSVWISGILHRYINYSFDFAVIKHSDVVYKVMEYVKANYNKKLTLDEISKNVYLSKSYLSSLFKEETGYSLSAYINKIRVEKSKILLMDISVSLVNIANMCGFEDQSYFTKVFKKTIGVSPKKYRDSRGKII